MSSKIPATVITGFLGAGKTSMIRHLIEGADGRRIALVINEFGELGIDGEILKGCDLPGCDEDSIVELANGCICCTVADDFLPTIEALLARPEPPEHIVIETSGLALPKPLIQAFNWPEVRTRVTVDGVVAVLDGPAIAEGRFADDPDAVARQRAADDNLDHDSPLAELYDDQLAAADLVVLNKADLLDEGAQARVGETVRDTLRPEVKLIQARHGAVDPAVLLGLEAAAESDLDNRPSHHDGAEEHDHDDFESFVVELAELAAPESLLAPLGQAIAQHDILRVKGFVGVAGKPMRLVVQGVGARIQHYFDRPWAEDEARTGRLVVIGETGLDQAAIQRMLET
ncbi:MAG: cobalamin biosynthesis protein CobW [Alphaproteobacteria bacterium]|nr:cobalamin biosynthesis protein CobW [Alphaproteobacteria bacterium]